MTVAQGIDTTSAAYRDMEEFFQLADDLLGGTRKMQLASTRWLPKFPGEEDSEYQWRLNNAVLRNMLGKAADLLVGHMFRNGINTSKLKLAPAIAKDFDKLGTSIEQYAASVARMLLTHGMAHTFSDFPQVEGERYLEQELTGQIRPYALLIRPADLKFAAADDVGGSPILKDARWHVIGERAEGLGEESYCEIRRLRISGEETETLKVLSESISIPPRSVVWEKWAQYTITKDGGEAVTSYTLERAGILKGHKEIPLRTGYSDFQGFMRSIPVLEPIAQKNREHWRASSDHNSIVQMSRFPMFYATGVSKDEVAAVNILGPHTKLASTNPDAKFGWVETNGSAVEQSFKDLERIANEAEQQTIEALYKSGSDTATGRRIDLLESLSPAQRTAMETERHMNEVLGDFGKWLGTDVGTIEVDLDFGFSEDEQMIIDALNKARALGDIPRAYYLKRLQELGVIGDDAKPDQLAADADNEQSERGLSSQFGNNPKEGDDDEGPDSGAR